MFQTYSNVNYDMSLSLKESVVPWCDSLISSLRLVALSGLTEQPEVHGETDPEECLFWDHP